MSAKINSNNQLIKSKFKAIDLKFQTYENEQIITIDDAQSLI